MNKVSRGCALLMLLAVPALAAAQDPLTSPSLSAQVTISVHNYADVAIPLLVSAEDQAKAIFRRSGVETDWLNCSPKLVKFVPSSCYFSDRTHLTLKIIPHAISPQVRNRFDVLGLAYPAERGAGYFAYVFYDHVQELAQQRKLGDALLADVMAHEIGHLLLGSTSHSVSGIMCAKWGYKDLRSISEGIMSFLPAQSRIMRDRLELRRGQPIDQTALVPDKTFTSAFSHSSEQTEHPLGGPR